MANLNKKTIPKQPVKQTPAKSKKICTTPYLGCCEPMWFYNSRFKCYMCNRIVLNVIGQSSNAQGGGTK